MLPRLIAIVGPTATGKTRRAVAVARSLSGEILSADSRQVYRGMDIGAGKDLEEYGPVPHHLINVADPAAPTAYNLCSFLHDAHQALAEMARRKVPAIVCGGTGMYVEQLLKGVQLPQVPRNEALRQELEPLPLPELAGILASMKTLHNVTDLDTTERAIRAIEIEKYMAAHPEESRRARFPDPLRATVVGVDMPRSLLRQRIAERLHNRMRSGFMVAEVEHLLASGVSQERLLAFGLEYRFITLYIQGNLSEGEMISSLCTAICQFAKRQMTWFRGMERRGIPIHWLSHELTDEGFANQTIAMYRHQLALDNSEA